MNDEKAREARARRKAERAGLILRRSRSRSADSPTFGRYRLVTLSARGKDKPETPWLDLPGIETALDR
jgi:hypothetical protein